MRSRVVILLLALLVSLGSLLHPGEVSANADQNLASVLIGNWQYTRGGVVAGTIRFDGLTGGMIYDNKYGTGSFSGKFLTGVTFEGLAPSLPNAVAGRPINLRLDFHRQQGGTTGWSFNGWVSDYSNGGFSLGKKL